MKKGSGIPTFDSHVRIPVIIYQKLRERAKYVPYQKSINTMIIELLIKALEAEEAQKKVVS